MHRSIEKPLDPDWVTVSGLLRRKCLACHLKTGDQPIPFAHYDGLLESRTLSDGQPLIVPGSPESSALVQMTHWVPDDLQHQRWPPVSAPRMPPDEGDWLTVNQMVLLARWIERGAPQFQKAGRRTLTEVDFPSAQECKICHPAQYEQWSRSMHAYAQKSPIFEAFVQTVAERTSGTIGTFCTRCHTPVGTALGERGLLPNEHRSALSMEGITCVVCHRRSHRHGRVNAQFSMAPGGLLTGCIYGPFDDPAFASDDVRHPAEVRPFIRTSAFCGSCHDVTSPEGLRLEEAFSEWRNSPAARKGVTCQQCHMGPVPGIAIHPDDRPIGYAATVPGMDQSRFRKRPLSDHSFAGPDYSLLPTTEFPLTLDWIREQGGDDRTPLTDYQQRTADAIREKNLESLAQADALRIQLLRNAARISVAAPKPVTAGQTVKLDVRVTSLIDGHNFPTGFSEERQAWVEVYVYDAEGCVLFKSGDFDENGDLRDEHSHSVLRGRIQRDRQLLNFQSKFVILSERGTERSVVIPVNRDIQQVYLTRPAVDASFGFGRPGVIRIQKSSLPPRATRERTYHFKAPKKPQTCVYTVRLLYRHLPPHLLDKIGVPHLKPQLQVIEIDAATGVCEVIERGRLFLRPSKAEGR